MILDMSRNVHQTWSNMVKHGQTWSNIIIHNEWM